MAPGEDVWIVRYSEIGLKGRNRSYFEDRLARNIRDQIHAFGVERVERRRGRIIVHHRGGEEAAAAIAERLADTPGIRSYSRARPVARDLGAIAPAAVDLAGEALAERTPRPATFRVSTSRSDKSFPMRSMEVDAAVGAAILEAHPELKVRLADPDLTVAVEIAPGGAFVMSQWRAGPGGLPVGSSGTVVLLLSGGIDSPVAGWLLQKRGCHVAPVYCHAFPFTGDAAREKVTDLAGILARRQTALDLRIAEIAGAQVALRERARPELLVVLYRRLMVRIAERIAGALGAHALATGESVGQVASQTLPNMRAIDAAAERPILRPLATFDKEETIALARRIGTYDISIRPGEDCCQLFVPPHPATRVRLEQVLAEETKVDVEALAAAAAEKAEARHYFRGAPAPPPAAGGSPFGGS